MSLPTGLTTCTPSCRFDHPLISCRANYLLRPQWMPTLASCPSSSSCCSSLHSPLWIPSISCPSLDPPVLSLHSMIVIYLIREDGFQHEAPPRTLVASPPSISRRPTHSCASPKSTSLVLPPPICSFHPPPSTTYLSIFPLPMLPELCSALVPSCNMTSTCLFLCIVHCP